jgi:hypothetical protein
MAFSRTLTLPARREQEMIGSGATNIDVFDYFRKVLQINSSRTLILIVIAMAIWLIGGNVVVALHYRRVGKSIWSGFKPFAFPFRNFKVWEWVCLAGLAMAGLTVMGLAIVFNYE